MSSAGSEMAEGQGRRDIGGEKLDARVSALGWEGVAATTTCDLEIVDWLGRAWVCG